MAVFCHCRERVLARQGDPARSPYRDTVNPERSDASDLLKATLLGVVEGLTEFLPVSSTGHLLLLERFFGFNDEAFGKTFVVLIQLGAILAILSIYFAKLWRIFIGAFSDPAPRRFIIGVLLAFLPAAIIGAAAHSFIKGVLFNPWVVCFTLIAGGAVLLWVDQLELTPRFHDATRFLTRHVSVDRPVPVPRDGSRRVAIRRDHRVGDAAGRGQARGGGIFVLPGDADHGRRLRL